jgi:alcohol dehydrogenase class IV
MNDFSFSGLGGVSFGVDRVEHLSDDVSALTEKDAAVVLISDPGLAHVGILDRVKSILEGSGRKVAVFAGLQSDPIAKSVDHAASFVRGLREPCVVGLGGGSALDVAKLAAVIAEGDLSAENCALSYHPFPKASLKKIMIPTTAGTGAEVTRTCVFSTNEGRKVWAWGEELRPDLVILDPTLTISLPAHLTAATGLDAVVHAIEACTVQRRNCFADAFGLHAIRLAKNHLLTAIEQPEDLNARGGMLLAATLAGAAIDSTGTGVAHSIGHALATISGVHHGRAVAIGLDAALGWNETAAPDAHNAVAEALGGRRGVDSAAQTFRTLLEQTGIKRSLAEERIDPEKLAAVMMAEENRPMLKNNARPIREQDALELARLTVSS